MAGKVKYINNKTGEVYSEMPKGFRVATNDEIELHHANNPVLLEELEVTYNPSSNNSKLQSSRQFYKSPLFLDVFGFSNPAWGLNRVNINRRGWLRNPLAMLNWTDSGNAAAAFITTPFAAYAAGEYALPWLSENVVPYLSARGWLGATQAAGNTPAWLTPTSATAIDATLAGSATGASINDMRENGPAVGNVLGTALGIGGLAYEATPTIMEGLGSFKNIATNVRNLNKLEKWYTGVPHREIRNSPGIYMDLNFPIFRGRVWGSNNPDYARSFAETWLPEGLRGKIFKWYINPEDINIAEGPKLLYVSNELNMPLLFKNGKLLFNPEYNQVARSRVHNMEEYVTNRGFNFNRNSTDDLVKESLNLGYDAIKFYKVYDGNLVAPDLTTEYVTPIDELILNPGTQRYSSLLEYILKHKNLAK